MRNSRCSLGKKAREAAALCISDQGVEFVCNERQSWTRVKVPQKRDKGLGPSRGGASSLGACPNQRHQRLKAHQAHQEADAWHGLLAPLVRVRGTSVGREIHGYLCRKYLEQRSSRSMASASLSRLPCRHVREYLGESTRKGDFSYSPPYLRWWLSWS